MNDLIGKLKGGDLRSIGRADEVISDILNNPQLFQQVFAGLTNDDPLIRMRSADVIEKVLRVHPEHLLPHKKEFLETVMDIDQQEVKWHAALMVKYLNFDELELDKLVKRLFCWIDNDKSKIVKVNAMQALFHLAKEDKALKERVMDKFQEILNSGSPAMVSRAKKLIKELSKHK